MKPLVILWSQVQPEHDKCWWNVAEHRINTFLCMYIYIYFLKHWKTGTFHHLCKVNILPSKCMSRISALCLQNMVRHHQKDTQILKKKCFGVYSLELSSEEDKRIMNIVFWVLELKWDLKGLLGGAWCCFDVIKFVNSKPTFNSQKMEKNFQIKFLP